MMLFALLPAGLSAWETWAGWRRWRAGRHVEAHESWRIAFVAAALAFGLGAVALDLPDGAPLDLLRTTRGPR